MILADLSAPALADAVEENPVAYWRACSVRLPGGEFHESDEMTWFASDFTSVPWFNQLLLTKVVSYGGDAEMDGMLAFFAETSRPMLWSITPSSRPSDL